MGRDHFAHLAVSGNDVNDPRRQSRFGANFSKEQGGQRCVFSGLDHYGVSHGKSRSNFPCHHKQGEIPGNDLSDHSVRPMIGHLFFHQLSGTGMKIEMPGHEWYINIATFPNRFTVVHCFDNREEARMFLNQACDRIEKFCPGGTAHSFPLFLGRSCTLHRKIDILGLGLANGGQDFSSCWISGFE